MIIQNKKAFSTMNFVVAMLIFSGVLALFILSVGSLANEYENTNVVNEEFAEKFDTFQQDKFRSEEMWNASTSDEGMTLIGSVEVLFYGTFQVISLIFSSVLEAGAQLFSLGGYFNIPWEVSAIFFGLIATTLSIIIIFQILSFVKGGRDL